MNYLLHFQPLEKKYELKGRKVIYIREYLLSVKNDGITGVPVKIKVDKKLFDGFPWKLAFDADEIKSPEVVTEAWFTLADELFFGYKILLKKELH